MDDTPLLGTCDVRGNSHFGVHEMIDGAFCCVNWSPLSTPKEGPGMTPEPLPTWPWHVDGEGCLQPPSGLPMTSAWMADALGLPEEDIDALFAAVTRVVAGAPGVPTTEGGPHSIYIPADGPPTIIEDCYTTSPPVPSLGVEDGSDLVREIVVLEGERDAARADLGEVIRQRDEAVELLRGSRHLHSNTPSGSRWLFDKWEKDRDAFLASLPSGDER